MLNKHTYACALLLAATTPIIAMENNSKKIDAMTMLSWENNEIMFIVEHNKQIPLRPLKTTLNDKDTAQEQNRLMNTARRIGLQFAHKNDLHKLLPSGFLAKLFSKLQKQKIQPGTQSLTIYNNGETKYEGLLSLQKEFTKESEQLFQQFAQYRELEQQKPLDEKGRTTSLAVEIDLKDGKQQN